MRGSTRFSDGRFALGLTLGFCIAMLLFVSISHFNEVPNHNAHAENAEDSHTPEKQKQDNQYRSIFWHWDGALVTSRDTLAQWIMASLSFVAVMLSGVAVWFVWKTLNATRKLANDTREIGDMQNRAWLKCGFSIPMGLLAAEDSLPFGMRLEITNIGKSPAVDMLADVFLFQTFDHNDESKISDLMKELIRRVETNFERPGVVLPGETIFKMRAEALRIDPTIIPPVVGVIPAACILTVYRIAADNQWHCTATIFDIFVNTDNGMSLGRGFPLDGQAISGDGLNPVMRRTVVAT